MAPVNPPFFMQANIDHPAQAFRRPLEALVRASCVLFDPGGGELAVTPGVAVGVSVAAGEVILVGTENTTRQGAYHGLNDAAYAVALATPDGTNPRNDLIVARVRDAEFSGADSDWDVVPVTGTPNASPVDPTAPANSHTLARVRVNAGATGIVTGNITDLRRSARLCGRWAGGIFYQGIVGANQTGISALTVIGSSLGPTVTVPSGRRIRASLEVHVDQSAVADTFQVSLRRNSVAQATWRVPQPRAAGLGQAYHFAFTDLPAAGTYSWDWTIARESGAGTATVYAGGQTVQEDAGPV